MTDFEYLKIDRRDDDIAVLTIDRPPLNALNGAVLSELATAAQHLADDDDLRAIVVTGSGRAFVAGADIAAMKEFSADEAAKFGRAGHRALDAIEALSVPTLAAVNGFALGGGLELALSCDLIYVSDKARLGLPEVGLGIIPGFGGTQRLGRRIGWHHARRLVFTGEQIRADEAVRLGLAIDVFEADSFLDDVIGVAQTIAKQGPVAVRRAKVAMRKGAELPLKEGNKIEIASFSDLWDTDDRLEGMTAFLEKREAQFKGE